MARKTNYIIFAGITVTIILIIFYSFSDTQIDENYIRDIRKYREQKDQSFKEDSESPIPEHKRAGFAALSYFDPDVSYRITADLTRLPQDSTISTPTSTKEQREFVKYGYADFVLENKAHRLLLLKPVGQNLHGSLFLAFTDETSGSETYPAGRYIDVKEPASNKVEIDFNMAYNPYCAYNDNYSCPIPPPENHLKVRILAGERGYKKE